MGGFRCESNVLYAVLERSELQWISLMGAFQFLLNNIILKYQEFCVKTSILANDLMT